MKKIIFALIVVILIAVLFFLFSQKNSESEVIGFQRPDSVQNNRDTLLSRHIQNQSINEKGFADYDVSYSGDQLLQYFLPSKPKQDEIVKHTGYTLAYNEQNEEADWVAYELTSSDLSVQRKRVDSFKPDPLVSTRSASLADYKASGYDRGHLAPAADMKWSEQAMQESFYMSNMTPQEPEFNRGIWEDLESQVRNWAVSNRQIYVVTGPVFEHPVSERTYIGSNKVAVPDAFYKIILDFKQPGFKSISFLIPNQGSRESYWQYTTSIDNIEKKTGLDFFPKLPDSIEASMEKTDNASGWK